MMKRLVLYGREIKFWVINEFVSGEEEEGWVLGLYSDKDS